MKETRRYRASGMRTLDGIQNIKTVKGPWHKHISQAMEDAESFVGEYNSVILQQGILGIENIKEIRFYKNVQ